MKVSQAVKGYLATLRRVPDEVILATANRGMDLGDTTSCLAGWVVREQIGRICNVDPDTLVVRDRWGLTFTFDARKAMGSKYGEYVNSAVGATKLFGGTEEEWAELHNGVVSEEMPDIELAYSIRIEEAVLGRKIPTRVDYKLPSAVEIAAGERRGPTA